MSIKYKIKKNPFGNESKDLIENIGGCIIPRDTPDYKQQRLSEYPSIEDQLDKIYHTSLTAWKSDIKAVKDKYPKTNSSSTTVGSVPSWVQEEVDKLP